MLFDAMRAATLATSEETIGPGPKECAACGGEFDSGKQVFRIANIGRDGPERLCRSNGWPNVELAAR